MDSRPSHRCGGQFLNPWQVTLNEEALTVDPTQMDWLSGRFMANTIHTVQYVHHLAAMASPSTIEQSDEDMRTRPKELITIVLRSCIIGFLKTCDLIWRHLMSQNNVYDVSQSCGWCGVVLIASARVKIIILKSLKYRYARTFRLSAFWRCWIMRKLGFSPRMV